MSRPNVRIFVPETPLYVQACPAEVHSIGLGQPPQFTAYRVFIFLAPPDAPERADIVHLSLDDARFLRDAIDMVLEQHHALTRNVN